ncbi:unnamed protein product [Cuscuta europaea]|uniref:Uncharacterized protein n=1 Tax=Cuscuta europaea TaxID=41803 RepID=A0A9P0Z7J1_CUSEU|nr:unnamed protein product [Cuscuta europaea]
MEPGCHCVPWCFGYKAAGTLYLRVQQIGVRCETKTMDNVFVTVVASIQYRALAEKASDAFYKLSNTKSQKASENSSTTAKYGHPSQTIKVNQTVLVYQTVLHSHICCNCKHADCFLYFPRF